LEVEHEEHDGHLYHVRYPFGNGSGGLVVATTRPETMLGDTAVAIHPEDKRYQKIFADVVILPLLNRPIPIIKDPYVDISFGTGALKITPAHDPNDFEIGNRHQLPRIKVIDDDGNMTSEAGPFAGLDRFTCRKAVVDALKREGLLEKVEPHSHNIGHCYRCKTIVEPNLSKQWFVSAKPLAEKAIDAVRDGKTRIIPDTWTATYFDWLTNIKDWCISRQIWWGHQIPAWTCIACGELVVALKAPNKCPACNKSSLVQETDVLDTWFSSALWPFSTMGWPEETPLLKTFYPTSVLVTGFDILFFWVARMMMMGIHFMKDVPFKDVYVHALVRDEEGKKMSKSKGNVIDPLNIIDTYGTDAFRFTLTAFAAQGRDIKMSEKRVEGYRHFINKIWNAARFALMNIPAGYTKFDLEIRLLANRWILSRLDNVAASVAGAFNSYRFNDAAGELYQFVWHEFCDWYLEIIKPVLNGEEGEDNKNETTCVLLQVLHDVLILLHPIIPFITEEIWHKLPGTNGSILKAAYPLPAKESKTDRCDPEAESEMAMLQTIVTSIRNIRGEMNISPSMALDVSIHQPEETMLRTIETYQNIIVHLAKVKSLTIGADIKRPKGAATAIVSGATVFVSLEGIIDFALEAKRLQKEIAKLENDLVTVVKKLNNEDFLAKAPDAVVAKVKEKHNTLFGKQQKLQANLDRMTSLI